MPPSPPESPQGGKDSDKFRQLVVRYKRLFNRDDGVSVLEDLKKQFGWDQPSAKPGMRNKEVWMAEGMKNVIRYIEGLRAHEFQKDRKPNRAIISQESP